MTTTASRPVPQVRIRDRYDDIMDALPLTPRQDRARTKVRRMLQVSEQCIERGGIDRLTTKDVALEAGVSIGLVYRYFPDRVAILDALRPDRHTCADRLRAVQHYLAQTLTNVHPAYPWTAGDQREFIGTALAIAEGAEA